MARFRAVAGAVARAASRGSKSLRQISGNNMFYAGAALLFIGDPMAMGFFAVLIAVVVFVPSSSDPLTVVPPDRLALWPLTKLERYALRALSPLLNPVAWLMLAGMVWKQITWGLWSFFVSFFLAGFWGSRLRLGKMLRLGRVWAPRIPAGILTQLVRKDLRQFLTALDLYCALLVAGFCLYLRVKGLLPDLALVPLTALMIVIMSTLALTLFGLDGEAGITRYSLLSLPVWQILLSKGIAFLILMLLVTLPLSPVGGMAGGLVSLAVGQYFSMKQFVPQSRWRFRANSPFAPGVMQMLLALLAFGAVTQFGALWLLFPLAIYLVSLFYCERVTPLPV